jgi:hypothetical protein
MKPEGSKFTERRRIVRFLTPMTFIMATVLQDLMPCSLVIGLKIFGETYCLRFENTFKGDVSEGGGSRLFQHVATYPSICMMPLFGRRQF